MAPRRAAQPAKLPFPVYPPVPNVAAIAPSTSRTRVKSKKKVSAMQAPAPTALTTAESQDSVLDSWSTLSIPKSVTNSVPVDTLPSASAPTGSVAPPPLPSISKSTGKQKTPQKPPRTSELAPTQSTSAVATAGPSSRPGPSSTSIPSAPSTTTKSRRRQSGSTSPSSPPAPRALIPEPAPPPPMSTFVPSRKPGQRLSSSSKDRRPPRHSSTTERRMPTPFPFPPRGTGSRRRSRMIAGAASVPLVPLMPVPLIPSNIPVEAVGGLKGSGFLPVRRPSPVPPSSSNSKSTRSSDSYVSLEEHGEMMVAAVSHPAASSEAAQSPLAVDPAHLLQSPRTAPRRPSLTHLLASFRTNSPRVPHLMPTPGVPRVFHPSPLNPHPPSNPLSANPNGSSQPIQRSPVLNRSPQINLRPTRTTHIIPLPSITHASILQRPVPLPQSEAAELWTPTQTGAEEYASDHPQDLVERAWEMEARDELERVKRWVVAVAIAWEGGLAEEEEEEISGDEFWQWEKPADIDLTKLVPNTGNLKPEEPPVVKRRSLIDQVPINDMSPTREAPPILVSKFSDPRTPSPYPAPQPPPDIHLESSSASSSKRIAIPGAAPAEMLNVPLTQNKSFLSLTSPSPFSGLPSPWRFALPTPFTPFRPLKGPDYPTPPAQEPLPPVFSPQAQASSGAELNVPDSRVPSALDKLSSYLSNAASPRPPSPETPPRIQRNSPEPQVHEPSHTRTRSRSSTGTGSQVAAAKGWSANPRTETGSTVSGGFTRSGRGRSPTRRSWKAASERASTRVGVGMVMERIGGMERARVIQPVFMDSQTRTALSAEEVKDAVASDASWHLSDGMEAERPRTASRSRSRSVYSSPVVRPETQASVRSAELFYAGLPPPPPPTQEPTVKQEPSPQSVPETLKATHHVESPPQEQTIALGPPPAVRPNVSASVLRRRKSHRAQRSALSLPDSEKEQEQEKQAIPLASTQISNSPASPPKSRANIPPTGLPISVPAPITVVKDAPAPLHQRILPSPILTPISPSSNIAFHKFMILLSQFSSDLSNDRRGVPRWKHDFAEAEEKVRIAYDTFRAAVERSKVDFRPWLRDVERMAGDREEEGEDGRPVMYVEDVWEKMMLFNHPSRGTTPARAVQEDIIRSVVSTWDGMASGCLHDVRDVLDQLVTSIVDLHFGCAGDGNELRGLVQSIADAQLSGATDITCTRLHELAMLESTYVFSASNTQFHHSASAILAQYKELRRHAETSLLDCGVAAGSPVPMADGHRMSNFKPYVHVPTHSMSRDSQAVSVQVSSTNTKTTSLFSKGPSLSTNPTIADDLPTSSDFKAGLRQQLAHQQRVRAESLRSANDAVQVALNSLRELGLVHLTSPEKLFEKLVDPDPTDEVLEVMANVEAYVDAASSRFIDYATLHIEHHLVNSVGEKIFTTVLKKLDLASAEIKDKCMQWMSTTTAAAAH